MNFKLKVAKYHINSKVTYSNYFWNSFRNWLKFGLSEKHTKFEKKFLMVLTNQLIYLVNAKTMRKIFSNYVSFSKSPNFTEVVAS